MNHFKMGYGTVNEWLDWAPYLGGLGAVYKGAKKYFGPNITWVDNISKHYPYPQMPPFSKKRKRKVAFGGTYKGKLVPKLTYGTQKLKQRPVVVTHKETNGTVTDPDVAFVGIGVNYEFVCRELCKAIVHCVFKEYGINVSNYDDRAFFVGRLLLNHWSQPASTAITNTAVAIVSTDSFNAIATSVFNALQGLPTGQVAKFKEFVLEDQANAVNVRDTHIDASGLYMEVSIYAALLLQNITDGSGATDDQTTSVNANPLYINVYDSNSNIVYQKSRDAATLATYTPWVHYNDTYPEVFTKVAATQFPAAQRPNQVADFFSNAKMKYKRIMQPGSMKKVQLVHHFSGNFNKLYKTFADPFSGYTSVTHQKGKQRIVAFDKMINTGEDVSVAYEMNQKTSTKYTYKPAKEIVPQYE